MEVRAAHLRLRSLYFPQQLTCAEYDGDGTDRQIWDNQPNFLMYCNGATQFLDEDRKEDEEKLGMSFEEAVARGIMNADGDVNPDWEGEQFQDEGEETDAGEDADVDMEDAGDGEGEGGEEVQQDSTPEEAPVVFSNLCFRPAGHGTH